MEQTPAQPEEQSIFNEEEFSMDGYDKHIRNARIMLFVLAGLVLLELFLIFPLDDEPIRIFTAVFIVVVSAIFVTLGFWSRKKPYTALLVALIVVITLLVLAFIGDPTSLFQGWFIKIPVILFLVMGLRNAREGQRMMKAFGKHN